MIATERVIIREADLPDLRRVGAKLRAGCPLHGSDHQRSLSIEPEGDFAGFGKCFGCGGLVLVEDMNPDAARRLKARGTGTITAEKLLRPVKRYQAEQTDWQRAELEALQALESKMRSALLQAERAKAYLAGRGISYDLASALGVGYLPPAWKDRPELAALQKWLDRLIFPLSSPDGRGYIGRALAGWHPGMDENEHKRLLDEPGAAERWRKTYPAGWFGLVDLSRDAEALIVVEGTFDRLALVAAGLAATSVVALAGSRDSRAAEWLPAQAQRVIIALDGDKSGKEAAEALRQRLYLAGITATICAPASDDGLGKDWSERLRLGGKAALSPVLDAARGCPTPEPPPAPASSPEPKSEPKPEPISEPASAPIAEERPPRRTYEATQPLTQAGRDREAIRAYLQAHGEQRVPGFGRLSLGMLESMGNKTLHLLAEQFRQKAGGAK